MYKILIFTLSIYLVILPVFTVDRENLNESVSFYQRSNLIAIIFLIDNLFTYKANPNKFWNFVNTIEIISHFGIILFSNLLFLLPTDLANNEVVGNFYVYMAWNFFSYLKFIRINDILMNMMVYKILIKVCLDIIPVMTDILKIYFIILFLYGAAGLFMFGGLMNTSYIDKYEELTGDGIEEDALIFNFNDITNSFIFFFNTNLAGDYMGALNTTLVLQKS